MAGSAWTTFSPAMEAHLRGAGWSPEQRTGMSDLARWHALHADQGLSVVRSFDRFMDAFGGLRVPRLEPSGWSLWFEPDLGGFEREELVGFAADVGTSVNSIGLLSQRDPVLLGDDDRVFVWGERILMLGSDPHEAIERVCRGDWLWVPHLDSKNRWDFSPWQVRAQRESRGSSASPTAR